MKSNSSKRGFEVLPEGEGIVSLPQRSTKLSSGYDLQSREQVVVLPSQRYLVKTGVTAFMLPNEEGQVRSRSGLALKQGVFVLNSPGTVDADYYPNEIGVILYNAGEKPFLVNVGDRIAQFVFSSYSITDDDQPKDQDRTSGFGHTGI